MEFNLKNSFMGVLFGKISPRDAAKGMISEVNQNLA
jgi:hypothetical protein